MDKLFGASTKEDETEWLSVSDLMAGLMIIFLFIAIVYIAPIKKQNDELEKQREKLKQVQGELLAQRSRIKKIAVAWQEKEKDIIQALTNEFKEDLPRWNAEFDPVTLLIKFKSPEVLFDQNSAIMKKDFKEILDNFFPRYVGILNKYRSSIEEIRIEGHTSSVWRPNDSVDYAYFENMKLSQDRTRNVLKYALLLETVKSDKEWLRSLLTANGLSSSRLIRSPNGTEDQVLSRRVEFRLKTKARSEIVKILDEVQK